MKQKFLTTALSILILLFVFTGLPLAASAADSFVVTSGTTLQAAFSNVSYQTQIQMEGGNSKYTFSVVSGIRPPGLNFTSSDFTNNGIIKGTPTTRGQYTINVKIKNKSGKSVTQSFSIYILPSTIKVKVTAPSNVFYDGSPHTAVATCYSSEDEDCTTPLNQLMPTLTYTNDHLNNVVDVGTYSINVAVPDGCVITELLGDQNITIYRAPVEISITNSNQSYGYDGEDHPAVIKTIPDGVSTYVEYSKEGEIEYTTDPPNTSGTYAVRVNTNDPNYEDTIVTGFITILKEAINFEAEFDENIIFDGLSHTANVTSTKEGFDMFEVSYENEEGNPVDENGPIHAGTYKIIVHLTDSNYMLGGVTPPEIIISPKPVTFTLKPETATVELNGEVQTVEIESTDGYTDEYEIGYSNELKEPVENLINAGVYNVDITLSNGDYTLAEVIPSTFIINPRHTLNTGNSPAARQADAEAWENDKAKWGVDESWYGSFWDNLSDDINADADVNTVIVNDIYDFTYEADPGLILEYEVNRHNIVKGGVLSETDIDGLYEIPYTYTTLAGEEKTFKRYLMVIGKIGDVNGDGYVNMIDANELAKNNGLTPVTLQQARTWDINKNNQIDEEDVNAVRNRYTQLLVPYYPWVE